MASAQLSRMPNFRQIKIVSVSSEAAHLTLCGRVVAGRSSADVRNAVESCCDLFKVRAFTLGMAEVTDIDAAGIGALVAAHRTASRVGATLSLAQVPPRVHRLLTLCRLDGIFGLPPASTGEALGK
jgi:anti-anti-sigma factor